MNALPREWIVLAGAALGAMNVVALLSWLACRWSVVLGRSRASATPTPFVRPAPDVAAAEALHATTPDERPADRADAATDAEERLAADLDRWRRRVAVGAKR